MPKASVKVMRSYDYCHFEICLGSDEELSLEKVDNLRKDAQRLTDKAVKQYQIAKEFYSGQLKILGSVDDLRRKAKVIRENYPQSEWTPDQKALLKTLENYEFRLNHEYDYEDDWEDDERNIGQKERD